MPSPGPNASIPSAPTETALARAARAFGKGDFAAAAREALAALELNERDADAWLLLGAARAGLGDAEIAVRAYEAALTLAPHRIEIANDLGRLAYQLRRMDDAIRYFGLYHSARPDDPGGALNLSNVLREQHRFDEAMALLVPALQAHPTSAMLWNALGAVHDARCDPASAAACFEEALRLDPDHADAKGNRVVAYLSAGEPAKALEAADRALKEPARPDQAARMRLLRSTALFVLGRIGEGWDAYEARLDLALPEATSFLIDRPRWDLKSDLRGKSLLVFGEQGLGDQFRFSGTLPDLLQSLGPEGRLTLAVEERITPLFRRTYPEVRVIALVKTVVNGRPVRLLPEFDTAEVDLWTPEASPMGRYRRSLADYPAAGAPLVADPDRVARWRAVLEGLSGLKVGLLWKSLTVDGARSKFFMAFDQWAPVLRTPGVSFVNLQYGEHAEDVQRAREQWGVDIWTPPGVDLRNDLDEVAAIACALDLVIGPENSATSMACACGAPTWMVGVRDHWHCQGTDGYPWYPQARAFNQRVFGDWDEPLRRMAKALAEAAKANAV